MLSPVLFALMSYLSDLQIVDMGCHVGNFFVGCIVYADDIAIIAPD